MLKIIESLVHRHEQVFRYFAPPGYILVHNHLTQYWMKSHSLCSIAIGFKIHHSKWKLVTGHHHDGQIHFRTYPGLVRKGYLSLKFFELNYRGLSLRIEYMQCTKVPFLNFNHFFMRNLHHVFYWTSALQNLAQLKILKVKTPESTQIFPPRIQMILLSNPFQQKNLIFQEMYFVQKCRIRATLWNLIKVRKGSNLSTNTIWRMGKITLHLATV